MGDVQGCADELGDLLDALRFDPASDRLYSVGDAVNRGPDSAGAVRRLRTADATMVLGNHELHLFEVAAGRRKEGGRDTLGGLLRAADADELVAWLEDRPLLHCEEDLVMVHAGIHPHWTDLEATASRLQRRFRELRVTHRALDDPELRFAVSARYCDPEGHPTPNVEPPPKAPFAPWDSFYSGARRIVFGHWAQRGLVVGERVRGLDTGCVYGKSLTAWIAEEDRFVQVPARRTYCPI